MLRTLHPHGSHLTLPHTMGDNGYRANATLQRTNDGHIIHPPIATTGRPSVYRPEMCEQIVASASEGKSMTECAVDLGISRKTLYAWAETHGEFGDALARARDASLAWWEAHGRSHLTADRYQAQVWRTWMAAHSEEYREATRPSGLQVTLSLGDLVARSIETSPVLTLSADPKTEER